MTITSVAGSTFLADTLILLRDKLKTNITSVSSRVFTSYPRTNVIYPMITVTDKGVIQPKRLGMQSEGTQLNINVEVRVWARNIKEKDEIFDSVYNYLRTDQFGSSSLTGANLHDFKLSSVVNVDEVDVKSKVMELNFIFICE